MVLEKQLLFYISLEGTIKQFPNNLKFIVLQWKSIDKRKAFKTVTSLPKSGHPSKCTPESDHAGLREIQRPMRYISDPTDLTKDVEVHDSTIRRLKKYNLVWKDCRRKTFLSKKKIDAWLMFEKLHSWQATRLLKQWFMDKRGYPSTVEHDV